jgi:hypothetical protein
LNIPFPWQIQAQKETALISLRECSKKSVQQDRSLFGARSVHGVREHGKMARPPLAAFFNIALQPKQEAIGSRCEEITTCLGEECVALKNA